MTRSGTIPFNEIASIRIYHAKRVKEKDMAQVLKETGGDFCFNGTIFSWKTFAPLCHCKADGKSLCKPDYSVYGVAWDNAEDFHQALLPCSSANAITCVPLIVSGKSVQKPNYQKDMGGKRPRTAIGLKQGRFAYYVTSSGYTPEGLRDLLFRSGWETAVMLDGGGSSCFRDKSGNGFACDKDRTIPHYIVVTLKHGEATEPKGERPMNVTIKAYSLNKEGNVKVSEHFKVREFRCPDGSDTILIADKLPPILEQIRAHFGGKPLVVHTGGGYRTESYNRKEGNAQYSQHMYGCAADISISGVAPKDLAAYARKIMPNFGGVGTYKSFVHVDCRETAANWNG